VQDSLIDALGFDEALLLLQIDAALKRLQDGRRSFR
jgi:hypothetical protein